MAVMNIEVEQEPTALQIKEFLNSTFSSMILIDSGSTYNMMSISFAQKIGLLLIPIQPCSVWLLNNQSTFITHGMHVIVLRVQSVSK